MEKLLAIADNFELRVEHFQKSFLCCSTVPIRKVKREALEDALAVPIFADGDVIAYSQNSWGDIPNPNNAATRLLANYNVVYAGGVVEVGIPGAARFSITFTDRQDVLAYLPVVGAIGPLFIDYVNPS